jgi:hypothetical protein
MGEIRNLGLQKLVVTTTSMTTPTTLATITPSTTKET